MIHLIIHGDPHAQKRHRHTAVKMGDKVFTRTYDPDAKKKNDLLWLVQDKKPDKPFDEPLAVHILACFKRPKSHYGTGKNQYVLKGSAPLFHTKKPDIDNVTKFIYDALNGVFWRDDSVICRGTIMKQYSDNPRIEIFINQLSYEQKTSFIS